VSAVNVGEARSLGGDGVAVPVVRYLAKHVLEPILHEARNIRLMGKGKASGCSLEVSNSGPSSAGSQGPADSLIRV
jgi:hypothetical protein